jgi:predicted RNA binding protein YcfA (HicA-like mRNA interferase family)
MFCVPLSGKRLVKLLKQEGWYLIRINGSHHIMGKGNKTITVPVHGNQSLGKGLEQKILKEAGLKK